MAEPWGLGKVELSYLQKSREELPLTMWLVLMKPKKSLKR